MGNISLMTRHNLEAHAKEMQEAFIRRTIDGICERKEREKVFPPRAKWRELRDIFKEEHWPILDDMVRRGLIDKQTTINYPTYSVNWAKYNEERAFDRAMAKFIR